MSGSEHLVSPMISERPCDVHRLRADFPLLHRRVRGKALVYLDNAATSQKPLAVLDALDRYYRMENANIHRGLHYLSEVATKAYEEDRKSTRLNSSHSQISYPVFFF